MLKVNQIRSTRERLGLSQQQLADLAQTTQQNVDRIERGQVKHSRFLPKVIEVLDRLSREQSATNETLNVTAEPQVNFNPPPEILGERDLPVFSAVEGGPGEMVVDTNPLDYVLRPWYVRNVKEAFAVLVVGESMVPEFKPGRMAVVNPKLPLVPNEPAIFVNREHGDFKATIKELVRVTTTHWIVRQHNPPPGEKHEFKLDRSEWPDAWRVVGSYYR